jgi:hypothetical protein
MEHLALHQHTHFVLRTWHTCPQSCQARRIGGELCDRSSLGIYTWSVVLAVIAERVAANGLPRAKRGFRCRVWYRKQIAVFFASCSLHLDGKCDIMCEKKKGLVTRSSPSLLPRRGTPWHQSAYILARRGRSYRRALPYHRLTSADSISSGPAQKRLDRWSRRQLSGL